MSISDNIKQIKRELPSNVELVAVSKFHPIDAVIEAYEAGQRSFGESRPQEMASKVAAMKDWFAERGVQDDIRWHFIGHLQTNKLKLVLPYVHLVQSVDSVHLLEEIAKWGLANDRVTDVLLECRIASETTKQGLSQEEILTLMTSSVAWPHVRFRGLMGMATNTDDEAVIRGDFEKIAALYTALGTMAGSCPNISSSFDTLSIGMSDDYRIAVELGSGMVRIGTRIFGERV